MEEIQNGHMRSFKALKTPKGGVLLEQDEDLIAITAEGWANLMDYLKHNYDYQGKVIEKEPSTDKDTKGEVRNED